MRVEIHEEELYSGRHRIVRVVLSEKNLLDLMEQRRVINEQKFRGTGESRYAYPVLARYVPEENVRLGVVVEPNDEHYTDRVAGPGSGLVD